MEANMIQLSERSSFSRNLVNMTRVEGNFDMLDATFIEADEDPNSPHSFIGGVVVEGKKEHTYKSRCYLNMLVLNIALSSLYSGYSLVYFAQVQLDTMLDILHFTGLSAQTSGGLLNGAIFYGAAVGGLLSGLVIKYLSRRNGILVINAFAFVVGGLIFIPTFYSLFVFRLCQGIAMGLYSSMVPIIIKELAPVEISGPLGSYTALSIAFGMFLAPIFAYVLSFITNDETGRYYWYYLFALPQVFIGIQTILLLFVYPFETPKYLLLKAEDEKARALIGIIYKQEYAEDIFQQKKQQIDRLMMKMSFIAENQAVQSKKSSKNQLPLMVAMNMSVVRQFSGINAISIYAKNIAGTVITGGFLRIIPSLVNLSVFIGGIASVFILIHLGRKPAGHIGILGESLANLFIILGAYITGGGKEVQGILSIVGLFICTFVYGSFLGPITWAYIPEIVEPKMIPFTTSVSWVIASIVVTLFPILSHIMSNPGPIFIFFGGFCILSCLFNVIFMVETKGKSQLQIKKEYKEFKFF